MSHSIFLTHRAVPGRRDELAAVWNRHMPAAVEGNPDHEAYFYCTSDTDPDVIRVYQQYTDAASAAAFLHHPAYLAYLEDSQTLLASPPVIDTATPRWTKTDDHPKQA